MRLGRNLAVFAIADIAGAGIGLLVSPITTRLLSQEQYGAVPLLQATWALAALVQFGGMDWAFPYFRAKGDRRETELVGTASVVAVLSAFAVSGVYGAIALATPWLANYAAVSRLELALFLAGVFPSLIVAWALFVLRFRHQAIAFARLSLVGRVFGALLGIPLMTLASQEHRLAVNLAAGCLVSWLAVAWAWRECVRTGLDMRTYREFSAPLARAMLIYGAVLIPGGAVYAIAAVVDRLLVGWLRGPADAALLSLSISVASVPLLLKAWFARVWDPHLVEWIATGNRTVYEPRLQQALGILAPLAASLTLLAALWSEPVVAWLYPASYGGTSRFIPYFVLAGGISTVSLVAIATVMIAHTARFHFPVYTLALGVNVLIGLLLIPRIGVMGAVLGTLASEVVILLVWIGLGGFVLKNLRLNWVPWLIILAVAGGFCAVYEPGLLKPLPALVESVVFSLLLISGIAIWLRRQWLLWFKAVVAN